MTLALANDGDNRPPKADVVCQPQVERFRAIDRQRKMAGISVERLLHAANIHQEVFWRGRRGETATRSGSLQRLERALAELIAVESLTSRPPTAIKSLVLAAEEILRVRIKRQRLTRACNPARTPRGKRLSALPASRLRRLAIYLVAVELEIDNVDIGRALGCSRENIRKARETVEELRDDKRVEALFEECGKLLSGRA